MIAIPESRTWRAVAWLAFVGGLVGAALIVALDQADLVGTTGLGRVEVAAIGVGLVATAAGAWLWRRAGGRWRSLLLFGGAAALLLGGAPVLAVDAATEERGVGFVHDRSVGFPTIKRRVLDQAGWGGTGVCRCEPDREVRIPMPGGFATTASLFLPSTDLDGADGLVPGIVLVHGNVWNARKAAPYRLWADRLADAGYAVLLFDMIGYGDSDDPYGQGREGVPAAYDRAAQADAALDALLAFAPVDSTRLFFMGHSAGVEPAIAAALARAGIQGVAVMVSPSAPSALVQDTMTAERRSYAGRRRGEQYRFIYGRDQPDWFRPELMAGADSVFWTSWRSLQEPGHPRFLLILGGGDHPSNHRYERQRLESLAPPVEELLVPGSDHYLNSAQSLGLVFYDRAVADAFSEGLAAWLAGP